MVESAIALRIANGAPPTMLAENYRQLANCYAKQSNPDYNKAFANYNKSIDIYKNLPLGSGAPMQKVVMLDYAKALEDFGQAAQAKDMREKANSLQQM